MLKDILKREEERLQDTKRERTVSWPKVLIPENQRLGNINFQTNQYFNRIARWSDLLLTTSNLVKLLWLKRKKPWQEAPGGGGEEAGEAGLGRAQPGRVGPAAWQGHVPQDPCRPSRSDGGAKRLELGRGLLSGWAPGPVARAGLHPDGADRAGRFVDSSGPDPHGHRAQGLTSDGHRLGCWTGAVCKAAGLPGSARVRHSERGS